jgi:GTP-binding protein
MKVRKFIDSAILHAAAGNGGDGCASFRREKFIPNGGPDGGDGGHGGSVILRTSTDKDSLIDIYFEPHRRAEHGGDGRGQEQSGTKGQDKVVLVPLGTEVWNSETGVMIGELLHKDQELVVAQGGRGGLGNVHFKSSTNRSPRKATLGTLGVVVELRLELKLIADMGLVGFPNAGKSSLITKISHAHPKIGAYPFTTMNPIIGTIQFEDMTSLKVADLPGLLKGAHEGIGLGFAFLRHIERARMIIYVIDMSGVDGRIPYEDYRTLLAELKAYQPGLEKRPSLIVANKMDTPESVENLKIFKKKIRKPVLKVSALEETGITELLAAIRELAEAQQAASQTPTPPAVQ